MGLTYTIVDAFTDKPFGGNPASVIVLDPAHNLSDETKQLIAREFNLSETAFVVPRQGHHIPTFGLRWFTPKVEVPLCGHATLAAAHAIFGNTSLVPKNVEVVKFETIGGEMTATRLPGGRIELDFPAGKVHPTSDDLREKVEGVVKRAFEEEVLVKFVGAGEAKYSGYVLIELDSGFDLENAKINPGPFNELEEFWLCIVTVDAAPGPRDLSYAIDFISRAFAPAVGVPEDPVCGSAHCVLGPYWEERLSLKNGTTMKAFQASARGGHVEVAWDTSRDKCKLRGNAVTVAKGELLF